MKKIYKKLWITNVITSILLIILGLFLFLQPEATISIIAYIIGGMIITSGSVILYKYFKENKTNSSNLELTIPVIIIVTGLLVILNKEALASIFPLILGIWIIISSINKLQYSLKLKTMKNQLWTSTIIITIIMMLLGILLIFNPFEGALAITKLIGLFIIIYAILNLLEHYIIKRNIQDVVKLIKEK